VPCTRDAGRTTFTREERMATGSGQSWKMIVIVSLVVITIALVVFGHLFWLAGLLIIALAMAGGALMYRKLGPPEQ
jgi:hypothetical protein